VPTEAHAFFLEHVIPNFVAFEAEKLDVRLAMNAAVALNQMADHFWHSISPLSTSAVYDCASLEAFRKELTKQNSHWAVLRDVAEAHKHVRLKREPRAVTSSSQSSLGEVPFGSAPYGTGPYSGESIVVTLPPRQNSCRPDRLLPRGRKDSRRG